MDRIEVVDEIAVGGRFVVVAPPHTLDGIVGEFVPPNRFGWAAVGDGLSFYQSWLPLDEPCDDPRTIFHEAARGPSALLRTSDRTALTHAGFTRCPRSMAAESLLVRRLLTAAPLSEIRRPGTVAASSVSPLWTEWSATAGVVGGAVPRQARKPPSTARCAPVT
ncbi:hypothetical protein [Amycolatopsis sp. NPDC051903]|uniref:hypothetical protein n=1 Tax=Amycolatopsis sp. NPDC051903 TaxID=3363936 RepID=UPI003791414E